MVGRMILVPTTRLSSLREVLQGKDVDHNGTDCMIIRRYLDENAVLLPDLDEPRALVTKSAMDEHGSCISSAPARQYTGAENERALTKATRL